MPKIKKQTPVKKVTRKRKVSSSENVLDRIQNSAETEDDDFIKINLYGRSGCLSGDTFIQYQIKNPETGKYQNNKGGTLENLYKRFHKIPRTGKGYYQRPETVDSDFYVSSITDEGVVFKNRILDVIDSGIATVFEITSKSGLKLQATSNHKFMVDVGYTALENLKSGDSIFITPNKRLKSKNKKARIHRPEVMVKYHPRLNKKLVNGCLYYRIPKAHFVYEAERNSLSCDQYKEILNTSPKNKIDSLWTVPKGSEIHHVDENQVNDTPENLVLVSSSSEHQTKYHKGVTTSRRNMNICVIEDKVKSIKKIGRIKVYDISVGDPYHNFIAAGFAVHNSGKTTLWSTFPKPILAVLCSGGNKPGELKSISKKIRQSIDKVVLSKSSEVNEVLEYQESSGKYATIVLDHASGLQDLLLKEILNLQEVPVQLFWGIATQQQYGQLAMQMKEKLRTFLNLDAHIVIVAQERDFKTEGESSVIMPFVASALTPSVVGWLNPACDFICQTFIRQETKEKTNKVGGKDIVRTVNTGEVEYCLRTAPDDVFTTKFRLPKGTKLPKVIIDPSYNKLRKLIEGE